MALMKEDFTCILKESNKGEFLSLKELQDLTSSAMLKQYDVFFCGPKPMRVSLLKEFKQAGISKECFHYEEFELR